MPGTLRQRKAAARVKLVENRPDETYLRVKRAETSAAERLLKDVSARWRGHEPEIAVLATTILILAVAALFAGADILFTVLLTLVAGATIWAPWRSTK